MFENEVEIFADTEEIVFDKNVAIKLKSIANQQKHDELVDDVKAFIYNTLKHNTKHIIIEESVLFGSNKKIIDTGEKYKLSDYEKVDDFLKEKNGRFEFDTLKTSDDIHTYKYNVLGIAHSYISILTEDIIIKYFKVNENMSEYYDYTENYRDIVYMALEKKVDEILNELFQKPFFICLSEFNTLPIVVADEQMLDIF